MPEKRNYPEPLEALLLILAIFVFFIVLMIAYVSLRGYNLQNTDEMIAGSRYLIIFGGSLFLIIPLIYARLRHYDIIGTFRLRTVPWRVIFFSILIGLSISVLSDELERLINLIFPIPSWISEMMLPLKANTSMDWVLIITGAVFITTFSEETLFRGFLQISLERKGDVTRAVLLSAVTWALIHRNPYWAVSIFLIGVIFGFMAWRTHSILPSFTAHATNNLLALFFLNLNMEPYFKWYETGKHVALPVLIISLAILVWSVRMLSVLYRRYDF